MTFRGALVASPRTEHLRPRFTVRPEELLAFKVYDYRHFAVDFGDPT